MIGTDLLKAGGSVTVYAKHEGRCANHGGGEENNVIMELRDGAENETDDSAS